MGLSHSQPRLLYFFFLTPTGLLTLAFLSFPGLPKTMADQFSKTARCSSVPILLALTQSSPSFTPFRACVFESHQRCHIYLPCTCGNLLLQANWLYPTPFSSLDIFCLWASRFPSHLPGQPSRLFSTNSLRLPKAFLLATWSDQAKPQWYYHLNSCNNYSTRNKLVTKNYSVKTLRLIWYL